MLSWRRRDEPFTHIARAAYSIADSVMYSWALNGCKNYRTEQNSAATSSTNEVLAIGRVQCIAATE
jgi:hypothetical protein